MNEDDNLRAWLSNRAPELSSIPGNTSEPELLLLAQEEDQASNLGAQGVSVEDLIPYFQAWRSRSAGSVNLFG